MFPALTFQQPSYGYQFVQRTVFSPIIPSMPTIVIIFDSSHDSLVSPLVRNQTAITTFSDGRTNRSKPVLLHSIATWILLPAKLPNHRQYPHQHHLHTLFVFFFSINHHRSNIIQLTLQQHCQFPSPLFSPPLTIILSVGLFILNASLSIPHHRHQSQVHWLCSVIISWIAFQCSTIQSSCIQSISQCG